MRDTNTSICKVLLVGAVVKEARFVVMCVYIYMLKSVRTDSAPQAIGPYSQAVIAGDLVFCSGQIAINPGTGELVTGSIREQTEQVFKNLKEVLRASGVGFESVASVCVYLRDMKDFKDMNEIYGRIFTTDPLPARVTVAVSGLPKGALVEISCIASKG